MLRKLRYPSNASKHLEKSGDRLKVAKYEIARGEAREVQRAARAIVLKGRLKASDVEEIEEIADCIIGSLTIMIKNLEDRL